jgi:signal transduction histidine kinase
MTSVSEFLLGRNDFMPHGQCFAWEPGILALHGISDALVALSYFSIPMTLLYFISRREGLEYKWVFGLFAAFITACGATHLFGIYVLWEPAYGAQGIVKAATATVSVATAVMLWFIVPKALALPGPVELRELNTRLEREVARQEAAQRELLRARDELEHRVQERTAELERAKLRAEAADRTKSEFLANVSHELRTPLNSIIGFSELIRSEYLGPIGTERYREYAKDINRAGRLQLELINDILDISKIEAGKLEFDEEPVALAELAADCVGMVQARAEEAGVDVSLDIKEGLPRLRADSVRLKQILLNLLTNAIKFTDGPGNVRVELRRQPGGQVQLVVVDTGIGIADDDIDRVTEPFVQAANASTRQHGGTGLGLALVKKLAEMHGAVFELESAPGRGTTARIVFPSERVVSVENTRLSG